MHTYPHVYRQIYIQYLAKLYPKYICCDTPNLPSQNFNTTTGRYEHLALAALSGGVWTSVQQAGSHFNGKRWDGSAHTAAQAPGSLNQCGAQSNWSYAGWQALWAVWLSASSCVGGLDFVRLGSICMWCMRERWEDKHASLHHFSFGVLNGI